MIKLSEDSKSPINSDISSLKQRSTSYTKSITAASKSSSEGIYVAEGSDTAITSMDDIKTSPANSNKYNELHSGEENNNITQNILPSTETVNPEIETIAGPYPINLNNLHQSRDMNSTDMIDRDLQNDSHETKGISAITDFTFPTQNQLNDIDVQEDQLNQTSSSDDFDDAVDDALLENPHRTYSVVSEVPYRYIDKNNDVISNVDPLTKNSDENVSIPLSRRNENFAPPPVKSLSNPNFKYATYPRTSVEYRRHSTLGHPSSIHTHQSIATVRIPSEYQNAELAQPSDVDHPNKGQSHASQTDQLKRHKSIKSGSFMNNSRTKGKMKADDLYNIPGKQISEKNYNYAIVYDLFTGIRVAVSRCSKKPAKITDREFSQVTKLIFNRQGNNQAPPTKYEFKFKDYAPEVFRDLRSTFNVNQADYLMSISDEIGVKAVGSSGKSGSSFYYSNDGKFIIKTIHRSEHRHLRKILKDYYYYVKQNPDTLLCQFYGLHRLKMTTKTGTIKLHVLIMNNMFPLSVSMSDSYDLKGSSYGRNTTEEKRAGGSCMKDLNFIEKNMKIHLSEIKRDLFVHQLNSDVGLLKRLNIMDYSLLLGFEYIHKSEQKTNLYNNHGNGSLPEVLQEGSTLNSNKIFDTNGGIRAIDTNGEEMDLVYYVGIIDCLTNYNTLKKLETFFRSLRHRRETISAVPPHEYGDRFLRFIINSIETPNSQKADSKKRFSKFKASFNMFTSRNQEKK